MDVGAIDIGERLADGIRSQQFKSMEITRLNLEVGKKLENDLPQLAWPTLVEFVPAYCGESANN